MTLSIIIVSWNVKALIETCLFSIFKNTKGLEYEIIVIDNNSKDGSQDLLKNMEKENKNLKVVLNNKNLGFSKANNQGIKKTKGKYILLLNPDTKILGMSLQNAVDFMDKNKQCGVLGSKIIGVDDAVQNSVRKFPTPMSQLLIFLKFHRIFSKLNVIDTYIQKNFDYNKISEVDQVMGAFLMTRKSIFDEIGLLDEKFYLWFEEVDFCKRVKMANYKVIYNPDVRIVHYGGESFNQMFSFSKQKIYTKSALYYFEKYYSIKQYWLLIIFRPISLFLALLVQIFKIK